MSPSLEKTANGQTSVKTSIKTPLNTPNVLEFRCDFFNRIGMSDYKSKHQGYLGKEKKFRDKVGWTYTQNSEAFVDLIPLR